MQTKHYGRGRGSNAASKANLKAQSKDSFVMQLCEGVWQVFTGPTTQYHAYQAAQKLNSYYVAVGKSPFQAVNRQTALEHDSLGVAEHESGDFEARKDWELL